ncbi:MAG: hypothetical protein LBS95_01360 [Mycoplasmataceae bacterium]|nr:hypothetical protein [Mycoplasmataceae bacterium]
MAFIFPFILICALGFSMGYSMAFPGAFCLGTIAVGINTLPSTIIDFKKSSLLKRISVTPIKPIRILLSICLFYLLIMVCSVIVMTSLTMLIFINYWNIGQNIDFAGTSLNMPSMQEVFANVNWGEYAYCIFIIIILSLSCGLALSALFRSAGSIQAFSIMIVVLTILLSGLALPNAVIRNTPTLWYLGYILTPFKSIITSAFEAWNGSYHQFANPSDLPEFLNWDPNWYQMMNLQGSNIFDFTKNYSVYSTLMFPGMQPFQKIDILNGQEKMATVALPFAWIVLLFIVTMKKFKWTNR